jgi:hypothetical protein
VAGGELPEGFTSAISLTLYNYGWYYSLMCCKASHHESQARCIAYSYIGGAPREISQYLLPAVRRGVKNKPFILYAGLHNPNNEAENK